MMAIAGIAAFLAVVTVGGAQLLVPGVFPQPPQSYHSSCRVFAQQAQQWGLWHPNCSVDGTYAPMQFQPPNNTFCLSKDGRRLMNGTLTTLKNCTCVRHNYEAMVNTTTHMMMGVFVPSCDRDGTYAPVQQHEGYTKCFSASGVELLAGRNVRACKCPRARFEATNPTRVGQYVPQCESTGVFARRQSHGSTGYSWCVNENGVPTTAQVPPAQASTLSC